MSHSTDTNFGNSISALIGVVLLITVLYTITVGQFASEPDSGPASAVAERLAPIGTVNTDAAAVAAAAPAAEVSADPGEAIYNRVCHTCHAAGVAGAPLLGNKEAWQPRIDLGMDAMLQTAINGRGAMPPRGTCMDCSDDDLKAVIEFMVGKVQ